MKLQTKKERFYFFCWVIILIGTSATLVSSRYISVGENFSLLQKIFFYVYATGQLFLLAWLFNIVSLFLALFCKSIRLLLCSLFVFSFVFLVVIVADTYVYQLYRFHLNLAMLDLFINGGREVIRFSYGMWGQIILIACGIAGVVVVLVLLATKMRKQLVLPLLSVFLICFAAGNLSYAWASSVQKTEITWVAEYVPWARPLTMNRFLNKIGVKAASENLLSNKSSGSKLSYPLNKLEFGENNNKKNIIFVVVDSLRADMLNKKNMPHLSEIAQENMSFRNHYSSGNATRAGIFGLFYSLPPSYWHAALRSETPSAFIESLQSNDYEIGIFTSAPLTSPEFDKTVFASVKKPRLKSHGETAWERDRNSIKDFEKWLDRRNESPFFAFIFLDIIHAYEIDPSVDPVFKPYWSEVNNLRLKNDTDPTEYFNLYKNSVYSVDKSISKVWGILKERGLLKNSIVVVTSDHGEEFNDNGKNFWGHNGNFTDAQIKIPLVISWPGRGGGCASSALFS